jgi:hypothetical protein
MGRTADPNPSRWAVKPTHRVAAPGATSRQPRAFILEPTGYIAHQTARSTNPDQRGSIKCGSATLRIYRLRRSNALPVRLPGCLSPLSGGW